MIRDILFRGKRVDNGEWVEGYYSPVNIPITGNMGHFINVGGYRAVEIDPETVSQFTGLTDRNGVKIFEGDIIEYTDGCNDWLGAVKYASDDAQFVVRFIGGDVESFDNLYSGDCEVIGNIYDNPELSDEGET